MKKLFLLSIAFIASFSLMSQNVIFEDNFESYAGDSSLHGDVYKVWEGTALVVDTTGTGTTAYDGSKYATSDISKNNWMLRKAVTLEAGKTYTLSVATRNLEGKKHVVQVIPGDTYSDANVECFNTDWELHTTQFTVVAGKEEVIIAVYRWPKTAVHVDAIKLIEGVATELSSKKQETLTVSQMIDGNISIFSPSEIKDINVYSLSGKLVHTSRNLNTKRTDLAIDNLSEGIYILSLVDANGIKSTKKIMKY